MTKGEFLDELKKGLCGFSAADIQKSVEFYAEMIDDRVEDGMTEEEAVADIGDVNDAVSQILIEMPLPKLVKAKVKKSRKLEAWEIVLLILGAPVWVSLLVGFISVLLSVYVTLWAAVITLYAVDVAVMFTGIGGLLGTIPVLILGKGAVAAVLFGGGLACVGLSILLFFVFNLITKGYVWITKKILLWIKSLFIGN